MRYIINQKMLFKKDNILKKNLKKVEKLPKQRRIIKKFFAEINFKKEIKRNKKINNKDKELEKENNNIEGPILGKVNNQKTPSFISKIIFSNQKAKGAIPSFKKQNTNTKTSKKKLKNQKKSNNREKNSWKSKYLKNGKREFWEKLTKEKGNRETDMKIKQHQNLIREKSCINTNRHPNSQEVPLKK